MRGERYTSCHMTGKKILKINDRGGYGVYGFRRNKYREDRSDRKKGIRKALNRIIRSRLKRELSQKIKNKELI